MESQTVDNDAAFAPVAARLKVLMTRHERFYATGVRLAQASGQLRGWKEKSYAEKTDALLWLAALWTVRKCRPSLAAGVDALADSGATPKDFDTPAGRAVLRANALLFSLVQQGVSSGRTTVKTGRTLTGQMRAGVTARRKRRGRPNRTAKR